MKGIFIHHPLFRFVFPPIYGTLVYILVLLIFDSIQQLEENFFSQEVLLCVGLTYALSESLRLVLLGANRLFPEFKSVQRRIIIYLLAGIACSVVIISAGVAAYFIWVVGYSFFLIELVTLNSIYLVTTVLYTLVYFGIFYLNHYNQQRLEQETALREKMRYQLASLQRDVNPTLLYTSLETLLNLVHTQPEEADNFLSCLSTVYRYSLENRCRELIALTQEISAAQNMMQLFQYSYPGLIELQVQLPENSSEYQVVPGTLQKLIEHAINRNLISSHYPLTIQVKTTVNGQLLLHYSLNERLLQPTANAQIIPDLKGAYSYFTDAPLEYSEAGNRASICIPLVLVKSDVTQTTYH